MSLIREQITRQLILRMQSRQGGWTRESLAILGVSWPPKQGWRKRLEAKLDRGEKLYGWMTSDYQFPPK